MHHVRREMQEPHALNSEVLHLGLMQANLIATGSKRPWFSVFWVTSSLPRRATTLLRTVRTPLRLRPLGSRTPQSSNRSSRATVRHFQVPLCHSVAHPPFAASLGLMPVCLRACLPGSPPQLPGFTQVTARLSLQPHLATCSSRPCGQPTVATDGPANPSGRPLRAHPPTAKGPSDPTAHGQGGSVPQCGNTRAKPQKPVQAAVAAPPLGPDMGATAVQAASRNF